MEEDCKDNKVRMFQGKAGWLKKAPCRLLATYKERYVRVERTEMVVYDNQDLETCTEKVDLENYDRCQELKSHFKKKHRLILIRSLKAGNKVCNVKFQTNSAEEKEAWIRALCDGINQAKNKVLDQVKVDESSNLEHVTRSRPKGNANRRPPTRIHMKEVAVASSDGLLRLDLDLENAYMPVGHHQNSTGLNGISNDIIISTSQSDLREHSDVQMVTNVEEQEEHGAAPKVRVIPMPPKKSEPQVEHQEEPQVEHQEEPQVEHQEEPQVEHQEEPQVEHQDVESEKQVHKAPPPPAQDAKPRPLHPQPSGADGGSKVSSEGAEPISSRPEPEQAPPTQVESEDGGGAPDHDIISSAAGGAVCSWDVTVTGPLRPSDPPLRPSANQEPPLRPSANQEPPLRPSANQDPPLRPSANQEPPLRPSANQEPPLRPSANQEPPLRPSANQEPPLRPSANQEPPLRPSAKARSASSGDLLSEGCVCVSTLRGEVCVQMEETTQLLSRIKAEGHDAAEKLLSHALEKLRVAECVLSKAHTLTHTRSRKSW